MSCESCTQKAIVYTKPNCPQCVEAKTLLTQKCICIEERVLGTDATVEQLFDHVGKPVRMVPQVFIDDLYVGSTPQLREHLSN